jgi:hypothetical protein
MDATDPQFKFVDETRHTVDIPFPVPVGVSKSVVGSVSFTHVCSRSKKQRAVILHVAQEVVGILRHYLDVFGSDAVGLTHHFPLGFANDYFSVVFPGLPERRLIGIGAAVARRPLPQVFFHQIYQTK